MLGDMAALLAAVSAGIALAQPKVSRSITTTGDLAFARMSRSQRWGLRLAGLAAVLALVAAVYDIYDIFS